MFQIDRNDLGLNIVTYTALDCGKPTTNKATVTVFGKGIIDRIALVFLKVLGTVFPELEPLKFKLNVGKDRYLFPQELYITRLGLKTLLDVEIEQWSVKNEIPLNSKTKENAVIETFTTMDDTYEGADLPMQDYFSIAVSKLHATLFHRMNGLELFISEKLGTMEGFVGEFEVPIDQETGEVVTRNHLLNSPNCYHARIKIQNESEGRRALFLKENKNSETREPAFSKEAEHTLKEVLQHLKDFITEEINLKQASEKLKDAVFSRKFLELDKTPILDHSYETVIVLDHPSGEGFISYDIANKITLENSSYIASQYPGSSMYPGGEERWKYWQMIFSERTPVIVKLNHTEKNKEKDKDDSYWPSLGETIDYSNIGVDLKVTNVKEETIYTSLTRRVFQVTQNNKTLEVIQVDFTGWPDKAVPTEDQIQKLLHEVNLAEEYQKMYMCLTEEKTISPTEKKVNDPDDIFAEQENHTAKEMKDTKSAVSEPDITLLPESPINLEALLSESLIEAEEALKETAKPTAPLVKKTPIQPGPIAVHCVAGQGRTGTFIGIHSSLKQENPDFMKIVYQMRTQRNPKMIETDEQFLFMKNIHEIYHQK